MGTKVRTPSITNLLETRTTELASDSTGPNSSLANADQTEVEEMKRLRAEAKKSVRKTRARLLSEQAICLQVRSRMLPVLREIAQFARRRSIYPRVNADPSLDTSSTAIRLPEVFIGSIQSSGDWSLSSFQSLLKGRLPQATDALQQLIHDLPEIHLQNRFGLVWSYGEYDWSDDYTREVTCGIEIVVICPNILHINDLDVKLADFSQTDLQPELMRAFYAPKHIDTWHDWEYERYDNGSRARFERVRERWNRVWSDRSSEVTFLDPLWKRIWYGLEPADSQAFSLRRRYD